ncbi:sulfurtransferase [Chitinophaga agrisoli]|uniref:Sulfurtransferase n=1 Tax=Chitinophaga agrisoli TaxID=2607653 RepID=A0A5B2VNJ7_9BACT|nr:sulfurtransferase [Chitinophaga agrisoli]KAA2240354.1 sulfurtransferase [Chitinophaga agrisoli]
MSYHTFIAPAAAFENLQNPDYRFVDCSYALADKSWGRNEFNKAHIPGAIYADLHDDLSGTITPGVTGRHPLPGKEELVQRLYTFGIDSNTQVVAYDSTAGFMAAARLWWLLKWAGHENVAVLAGGKQAWDEQGFPLTSEIISPAPKVFNANFHDELLADADEVAALVNSGNYNGCLIDSRTADRYAGQNETIDPVAGHIPTAISKPFNAQLNAQGGVADAAVLKEHFAPDFAKGEVIFYCGSGVTAAFNVLLAVHAGYTFPKLYAGSWSEWITDPQRPVA